MRRQLSSSRDSSSRTLALIGPAFKLCGRELAEASVGALSIIGTSEQLAEHCTLLPLFRGGNGCPIS